MRLIWTLICFCIGFSIFGQEDKSYYKVNEFNLGYFNNKDFHTNFAGLLYFDYGIGKEYLHKRRVFHLTFKSDFFEKEKFKNEFYSLGLSYTKNKKLFSFDKNGLFIGTNFSLSHSRYNKIPQVSQLFPYYERNYDFEIKFNPEYVYHFRNNMRLLVGFRMNVLLVGWSISKRDDPSIPTNNQVISQPNTLPFAKRFELYIGTSFKQQSTKRTQNSF